MGLGDLFGKLLTKEKKEKKEVDPVVAFDDLFVALAAKHNMHKLIFTGINPAETRLVDCKPEYKYLATQAIEDMLKKLIEGNPSLISQFNSIAADHVSEWEKAYMPAEFAKVIHSLGLEIHTVLDTSGVIRAQVKSADPQVFSSS